MIPEYLNNMDKFFNVLPLYGALLNAYNEPHRRYHNVEHIFHMISLFKKTRIEVLRDMKEDSREESLFIFAIICHDLVYIPGFPDNEEASLELAAIYARMAGLNSEETIIVRNLIRATKHNEENFYRLCRKETPKPLQYIHDLDMAILAEPYPVFEEYDSKVKKEYLISGVSLSRFNEGRKKFLEGLLEKEHIFVTSFFKVNYDQTARNNIKKILSSTYL